MRGGRPSALAWTPSTENFSVEARLELQVAPTARGKGWRSGPPGVAAAPFPENTEGNSLFWKKKKPRSPEPEHLAVALGVRRHLALVFVCEQARLEKQVGPLRPPWRLEIVSQPG